MIVIGRVTGPTNARARQYQQWFGLSAVEHLPSDYLGALSFAIHGSTTLGEALQRLARIFALINQHASLALVEDGAVVHVRFATRADASGACCARSSSSASPPCRGWPRGCA